MKSIISKGTICIKDNNEFIYKICDLEYFLNEDGSFKYTFIPNFSVINLTTFPQFQGIPGLDLNLRREKYIRENKVPVFISERVPQENREDYYELLKDVGLEYMDPILYLIRTKLQYFGDNLFMVEYSEKKVFNIDQFGTKNNQEILKEILTNIVSGDDINIFKTTINDENRKTTFDILMGLYLRSKKINNDKKLNGINIAKRNNKYTGRKPISIDHTLFLKLLIKIYAHELKVKEACKILSISKDKFYRYKKINNL